MKRLLILLLGWNVGHAPAEVVRVASFNIRYDASGDRGERDWKERRDLVVATVGVLAPDVMGVQEALHKQKAFLEEKLLEYAVVGCGRDDGKEAGEFSPVFYRKDRYRADPEEQGTFWLSDTPEVPGSMTWGNEIPRVCTWVRLHDLKSGGRCYVYNTHWDHRSQASREKAGRLILERIVARKHADEPVIVTGDFNATENNPAVALLLAERKQNAMRNTFLALHPDADPRTSFHGWSGVGEGTSLIDHILVSDAWKIQEAWIERSHSGTMWPSDHFPVGAVLSIGDAPAPGGKE